MQSKMLIESLKFSTKRENKTEMLAYLGDQVLDKCIVHLKEWEM